MTGIAPSVSIFNALPGIVPSARSYAMGDWPQKRMKMRNGRTDRWGLISIPTGDELRLSWENITYQQAETLCITWDISYGTYAGITLPPEILAGMSSSLAAFVSTPFVGATWHFTGPPRVLPAKAGRCTVEMPLGVRGFVRQDV